MSQEAGNGARLSERELQVLVLVVDGFSNQEIADQLGVSPRTVQGHIASATRKTGTRTRTQLAVYALRTGLVPLHPFAEPPDRGERV